MVRILPKRLFQLYFRQDRIAGPVVDLAQAEMHAGKIRVLLHDLLVFLERVSILFVFAVGFRLQGVDQHGVCIHVGDLLERMQGHRPVKTGQLVPDLYIAGVVSHELIEILHGLQLTIERLEGHGAVISGAPILRVAFQLGVESGQGFFKIIQPEVRQPEIEVRFRVLRVCRQDLLKNLDGLGKLKLSLVHDAEPFEDFRLSRKACDSFGVYFLCAREIFMFLELTGPGKETLKRGLLRME